MKEKNRKNSCGGHLVFQKEAKNYDRHALLDIKLWCKFVEFMFINEGSMKPFVKGDERTHTRTHTRTYIGHFIISGPDLSAGGDKNEMAINI